MPGYRSGDLSSMNSPRLAAHRGDGLGERRDAGAGELRVEPVPRIEATDFRQREVGQGPLTPCLALDDHLSAAIGEDLFDVGRALERQCRAGSPARRPSCAAGRTPRTSRAARRPGRTPARCSRVRTLTHRDARRPRAWVVGPPRQAPPPRLRRPPRVPPEILPRMPLPFAYRPWRHCRARAPCHAALETRRAPRLRRPRCCCSHPAFGVRRLPAVPGTQHPVPGPALRMAHGLEFVERRGQPFQPTIVGDEVEME